MTNRSYYELKALLAHRDAAQIDPEHISLHPSMLESWYRLPALQIGVELLQIAVEAASKYPELLRIKLPVRATEPEAAELAPVGYI